MHTILIAPNGSEKEHLNVSMTYEQYQEYQSKKDAKFENITLFGVVGGMSALCVLIFLGIIIIMLMNKFIDWLSRII